MHYPTWVRRFEKVIFEDTEEQIAKATYRPLISIVVPCFNTPEKYWDPLLVSVLNQVYENWELIVIDGSPNEEIKAVLKETCSIDDRIKYHPQTKNLGISDNTNKGFDVAKGEFVALLDHDDTLSPFALAEVVLALNANKKLDLIYSDEDKISDNGKRRLLPFFKPDWSPDLLTGVNYITHLSVARTSLIKKIGGMRSAYDGAQDYDYFLRLSEQTDNIHHIPKVLYHWRQADGSTSVVPGEKSYADTAGQAALKDAARRRKLSAEVVEIANRPTNYRLKYVLPESQPKVSIIIPFKDKASLLKQCVGSILAKSTYKNFELILVSNNSTEKALFTYLDKLKTDKRCRVFTWDKPFNYSAVNNYGRSKAKGEYLILLNNDTKVITPEWIEELIGVASQPHVGSVGAMLHYPTKQLQHAGVIVGMMGAAAHVFRKLKPDHWTAFGLPAWPRNYLAVTAACVAVKASKYDEVGGLDERFVIAGQDVAFGISLHEKGYRNVYWPFAELTHFENVSVGSYSKAPINDFNLSMEYYRPYMDGKDPFYNPNLDIMSEIPILRRSFKK